MSVWVTTRHRGMTEWLAGQGFRADRFAEHFDPAQIAAGDLVVGTLPCHLAAEICRRGGRYFHLAIDMPPDRRGQELSAADLTNYGARLEEYRVEKVEW